MKKTILILFFLIGAYIIISILFILINQKIFSNFDYGFIFGKLLILLILFLIYKNGF